MTPEIWFEYVAGTILAVGFSLLLLIVIAGMMGIEFSSSDKSKEDEDETNN